MENVIHHTLEGGGGIAQPKEHYKGLIQPSIGAEHCLPLISGLDPDIVKAPM